MYLTPSSLAGRIFATGLLLAGIIWTASCSENRGAQPDERLQTVLSDLLDQALDPLAPGRGLADYPTNEPADIPKAYAMVLKSALQGPAIPQLDKLGEVSAQRLIADADLNQDGQVGWGLPFEWDAFGDGTVNPANTDYAISTAIVVDGLLDLAGDAAAQQRSDLLDLSFAALLPYLRGSTTPAGLPPYSLAEDDLGYDVLNTAAYLAAVAQRLSQQPEMVSIANELQEFADVTMQALVDNHQTSCVGDSCYWYWQYSLQPSYPNDLPHAAYIAYSIETYRRFGGRLASLFPRKSVLQHFRQFVSADRSYIRAFPSFVNDARPARSYDLGFALATLCIFDAPLTKTRETLTSAIAQYRLEDGHYAKYPVSGSGASDAPPFVVNEYETYLLFAATACL